MSKDRIKQLKKKLAELQKPYANSKTVPYNVMGRVVRICKRLAELEGLMPNADGKIEIKL